MPALLILAALSGCARTPWTSVLEGEQKGAVETAFFEYRSSQQVCSPSWDTEVDISWTSTVQNFSFSAYSRMLEPFFLKLIFTNPLGQPLRIIGANATTYHAVDTVERSIVSGSLRSWAIRYGLPLNMVQGARLDWIGGRISATAGQLGDIRLDTQKRGAWLSIHQADGETVKEHILFDWEGGNLIARLLLDDKERPFATINYSEWQEIDRCLYPHALSIEGLPLGGQVGLRFSDIRQNEFVPADFNVEFPAGYSRTLLP